MRHLLMLLIMGLLVLMSGCWPVKKEPQLSDIAKRSAIVVDGTVLRTNASDEPLLAASANTVVIKVEHMYAGAEITGDQTGRNVTVILSRPLDLKVGTKALFLGNPRFVGKSLTMVDEGEKVSPGASEKTEMGHGLQARRDKPVRNRLATASLVFRGKVESEHALAANEEENYKTGESASEHDPEWHVAAVRVITPLRDGEKGSLKMVIFPASIDVMWFNSPKLKTGQEAIFITHKPSKEWEQQLRATGVMEFIEKQPAELVTHPFDVLPASDEARVRGLLEKEVR